MVIGIDIDDTISETCEVMLAYAQEYSINELGIEPILRDGSCTTHRYVQHLMGWENGEDEGFFRQYYKKIVEEAKPKTLAVEYLNKLHDEGHKIVLITARFEFEDVDIRALTKKWIELNKIPCDELVINAENKLIACKEHNVDVFMDDSYTNCKMVSEAGIKTFIMDSKGNQGYKDEKIERVYSWPHVYMKINEK